MTTLTAIRQDAVSRLTTLLTGVAAVYDSRSTDLADDELPAVVVQTPHTNGKGGNAQPNFVDRHTLWLHCCVAASSGTVTDAQVAAARDGLERAALQLLADPDFIRTIGKSLARNVERGTVNAKGNLRRAASNITFEFELHEFYAPVIEDDLELVSAITSVGDDDTPDVTADMDIEVAA